MPAERSPVDGATLNIALKIALLTSGRHQYLVAVDAQLSPTRLSEIVRGRHLPTPDEARRVAAVLGQPQRSLFPRVRPERAS
jgi:hypothetical protein